MSPQPPDEAHDTGRDDTDPATLAATATVAALADPYLGRVLDGRFRVDSVLGEGGMGRVYRARQLSMDREVAVKLLRPERGDDKNAEERFLREAKVFSTLRHPNTVTVYDFGRTPDGALYLVMELLVGKPLSEVLAQQGRLSPARLKRIYDQICDSLAEAHAAGLVHRDLKPENVFLLEGEGHRDTVKVLDFGIARMRDSSTNKLTRTGTTVGTPTYMSPEQVQGQPVDGRSDIYSLGVMMYELLVGSPPFDGPTPESVLVKHVIAPPPKLSDVAPEVAPAIGVLLQSMLGKEPSTRPSDVVTLQRRLHEAFGSASDAPLSVVSAPGSDHWEAIPLGVAADVARERSTGEAPVEAFSFAEPGPSEPAAPPPPAPTVAAPVFLAPPPPAALTMPVPTPTPRARRGPWLAAAVAVVIAAAALAVLRPWEGEAPAPVAPPPTVAAPAAPAVEPPASQPGSEPAKVVEAPTPAAPKVERLLVSSAPAGARVTVAGADKGVTPTALELGPGERETAVVHLELPGHDPRDVPASAAVDGKLHVALIATAQPLAPSPEAAAPVEPRPRPTAVRKPTGLTGKYGIR